jgi:hypothetical protein
MNSTTFSNATHLVFTSSRAPDLLRSSVRNEFIEEATIANRSNYTRVTFKGANRAAFLIPVGPYSLRVSASPTCELGEAQVNLLGLCGEKVGMSVSPAEMRAMAYGLLAAANWMDTRDTPSTQRKRKPAEVTN